MPPIVVAVNPAPLSGEQVVTPPVVEQVIFCACDHVFAAVQVYICEPAGWSVA
jgi:hypothetical protein